MTSTTAATDTRVAVSPCGLQHILAERFELVVQIDSRLWRSSEDRSEICCQCSPLARARAAAVVGLGARSHEPRMSSNDVDVIVEARDQVVQIADRPAGNRGGFGCLPHDPEDCDALSVCSSVLVLTPAVLGSPPPVRIKHEKQKRLVDRGRNDRPRLLSERNADRRE